MIRILMKFDMPSMPAGATLQKAYLHAVPTGIEGGSKSLASGATLFELNRTDWWQNTNDGDSFPVGELGVGSQFSLFDSFFDHIQLFFRGIDQESVCSSVNRKTGVRRQLLQLTDNCVVGILA